MAKDPNQVAADWASKLGAATSKITAGVQAVTVAPGQMAARQKAVYLQNVQAAGDKWAARTAAVPLGDWQAAMVNKGIPRIASGASASQAKFASFLSHFLPYVDQARRSLPARGTLDQNIARMVAMVRANAAYSTTTRRP